MLLYQTVCYLQNHKTGCTFVETFLKRWCAEELRRHDKHAAPGRRLPRVRLYFTNVREPLSLYRSLFAFGLDGRGTVFLRLRKRGQGALYEAGAAGFPDWLDFVLQPENAPLLDDRFTEAVSRSMGLMTWRFLRLACWGFESDAIEALERGRMGDFIRERNLLGAVLKQETLRADLAALARGKLSSALRDVDAAVDWIANSPKVNETVNVLGERDVELDPSLIERVRRRESFLYANFYRNVPAGAGRQDAGPM